MDDCADNLVKFVESHGWPLFCIYVNDGGLPFNPFFGATEPLTVCLFSPGSIANIFKSFKMEHSIEQVHHTIEMDESMGLHKTGWAIQRVGWIVLFVIVVLAALGLFGSGILSQRTKEVSGNMIEYERYGRYENATYMHFKALAENGKAILIIPQQ